MVNKSLALFQNPVSTVTVANPAVKDVKKHHLANRTNMARIPDKQRLPQKIPAAELIAVQPVTKIKTKSRTKNKNRSGNRPVQLAAMTAGKTARSSVPVVHRPPVVTEERAAVVVVVTAGVIAAAVIAVEVITAMEVALKTEVAVKRIKWTQKGSLIKLGNRYLKIVKILFGSYLTQSVKINRGRQLFARVIIARKPAPASNSLPVRFVRSILNPIFKDWRWRFPLISSPAGHIHRRPGFRSGEYRPVRGFGRSYSAVRFLPLPG
jgi:hypothetical protein